MKLLSTILCFMFFSSIAQAVDIIGVQEQIDKVKEDVQILYNKVYRDNEEKSSDNYNLEENKEYSVIVKNLNGKVEEIEHKLKLLDEKIETINKDIDVRFRLLEGKPISAGKSGLESPKKFDTIVAKGAPKSVTGEDIDASDLQSLEPEKSLSVDSLYTTGLEALKAGDGEKAEIYFSNILNKYPSDKLAGNAQYWLGEVYYKDKKFEKAAVAFAKGYNDYKSGSKGADCLLKLGLSMAQLGKKNEACLAFVNLPTEFVKAPDSVKAKAKNEAKRMGCE